MLSRNARCSSFWWTQVYESLAHESCSNACILKCSSAAGFCHFYKLQHNDWLKPTNEPRKQSQWVRQGHTVQMFFKLIVVANLAE